MRTKTLVGLGLAMSVLVGTATARSAAAGYLTTGVFDVVAVLPPAPRDGDARDEADRAIFRATRALKDTPRWALATNDVQQAPEAMLRDFSCAVGVALTPANAPRTAAFIHTANVDTTRATSLAKAIYKRHRPFVADPGPVCEPKEEVMDSYDYPSGHTTYGWTWATLLAEAVPDRAAPILARGRAYGESRAICGVHNASAVEAGRLSAASTLAAIAPDPRFQADRVAAAAELARLRANPATPRPDARACAAETALVAARAY